MANTLKDAQDQAIARLAVSPQARTARRDAELLLLYITGLTRAALITRPEQPLSFSQLESYFQAVERRAQSEPIQYIVGKQEFYGLEFDVSPAVLIPRPETEHLVEAALEIAQSLPETVRILDVGTGSGAIAVALAHHLAHAIFMATDISESALKIAKHNAQKHVLESRISFVQCDLVPADTGQFDLVCSNPPYIANGEMLETQVAAFEPSTALYAGPTGIEVYQRLIPAAAGVLHTGGWILLEIGYGQSSAIDGLLMTAGLQKVRFAHDLQGIPRVAIAQKA